MKITYIHRRIFSSLLFATFTINTSLTGIGLSPQVAQAQLPDFFEYIKRCDSRASGGIYVSSEQIIKPLEREDFDTAIQLLQASLTIASQNKESDYNLDLWLSKDYNGVAAPLEKLIEYAQRTKQTAKILPMLEQTSPIVNRIGTNASLRKTNLFIDIANFYHQLGKKDAALIAINKAIQAEKQIKGATFRANSLTRIALTYLSLGQKPTAMEILATAENYIREIPQSSANQIGGALFNIAQAYAKAGTNTNLEKLIANQPQQYQTAIINGATPAYIHENKLDLAAVMVQRMPASTEKVLLLGQLAAGYGKNKQQDRAKAIFNEALQFITSPTNNLSTDTKAYFINELTNYYLQAGLRDEAWQLVRDLMKESSYYKNQALQNIAIAYGSVKQNQQSSQVLSEFVGVIRDTSDTSQKESLLRELLVTAAKANQFEWIAKEWQNLKKTIDNSENPYLLEAVAIAYTKTGKYEEAVKWVEKFTVPLKPIVKVNLFGAIASVAGRNGNSQFATNLLQKSVELTNKFTKVDFNGFPDGGTPDSIKAQTLATIALKYAQIGQIEKMRQLLNKVTPISSQGTLQSYPMSSLRIFDMFLANRVYVGAMQIADSTKDVGYRQQRLKEITRIQLEEYRLDVALNSLKKISITSDKIELLQSFLQRYKLVNKPNTSYPKTFIAMVDEVSIAAQKQKLEASPKALNLWSISQIYRDLGNRAKAINLLDIAFPIAQKIPGDEYQVDRLGAEGGTIIPYTTDRGSVYENIATQYAMLGQTQKAIQVTNKLQNQEYRKVVVQDVNCILRGKK